MNKRKINMPLRLLMAVVVGQCFNLAYAITDNNSTLNQLKLLSLNELTNIEVSIASKTPQRFFDTAAAVFVITEEDIKRAGVTRLADLLRMVPGFNVAHIDNNIWAVSGRGFGARFANKLLVSIDGRTIYNPLFSGVFWEMQDVVFEDIARIEVIRGPGGAVWGSNAVNGVVNIITKKAQDNQGGRISGGGGNTEKIGTLSYGGKVSESVYFHGSAKTFDRKSARLANGANGNDDASSGRVNLRLDWQLSDNDALSIFGEIFDGHNNRGMNIPDNNSFTFVEVDSRTDTSGNYIMFDWQHDYIDDSGKDGHSKLRFFYDQTERHDRIEADVNSETFDLEYQHQAYFFDHHSVSWGLGYRLNKVTGDATSEMISFAIEEPSYAIFSAHIQDEITLDDDDSLFLTLGSKFEDAETADNGIEVQPTVRIRKSWTDNMLWAAVSKSARTPSVSDHALRVNTFASPTGGPGGLPIVGSLHGDKSVDSGKLVAYEVGFRSSALAGLLFDFTAFYNEYDDLISSMTAGFEPVGSILPDGSFIPEYFRIIQQSNNGLSAYTNGIEAAIDWQVIESWKLRLSYSYLDINVNVDAGSDQLTLMQAGESPRNQMSIRSLYDFSDNLTLDFWFRYVDELKSLAIDDYVTADFRLGWTVNPQLEVSLTGRNLFDKSYPEFGIIRDNSVATEVEQGFFVNVQWTF